MMGGWLYVGGWVGEVHRWMGVGGWVEVGAWMVMGVSRCMDGWVHGWLAVGA